MPYYTIQDLKNISINNPNIKLEDSIKKIFKDLSNKLIINESEDTNYQKIKRSNDEPSIKKGSHNKPIESEADWGAIRNFKATVIEQKIGIEKR